MGLTKDFFKVSPKSFIILLTILFTWSGVQTQKVPDSARKILLASLDKTARTRFITKESNAVYPDILKGNEAKTLSYVKKFADKRRDYLLSMYTKGHKFLPQAVSILEKYDIPQEFKVLLIMESAFNANAVSKAGAVGYWQIMDIVAKEYGIKYVAKHKRVTAKKGRKSKTVVKYRDDRKNFKIATHTAARYLNDRRRTLDDKWLLIAASYNCGIGNVGKAIRRSGKKNPDFWDIKKYLPSETQAYVMNFIALNVIYNNYDLFAANKLRLLPEKIMLPVLFDAAMIESDGVRSDR